MSPYWVNPTVGRGKSLRGHRSNTHEANACMKVALDAFSDATTQPRFPDGKASESVGMKYQMINEVEATVGGIMELVFFPGLNTCVTITNATSKSLGPETSAQNAFPTKIQRISNHVTGDVTVNGNVFTFEQQDERHIAKWRVVSYGLLLSLVNNSEENDGWWEACRITPSNDITDYGMSAGIGTLGTPVNQPFNFFHNIPSLTSSEMLNSASYSTGKLRNIHNVVFQLNPEYDDHEFVDLAKVSEIDPGPAATLGNIGQPFDGLVPPTGATAFQGVTLTKGNNASTRVNDEIVEQFIDGTFDAIFIRIHGVDNSLGGRQSRLTLHTVMNQEIVYDEKALNAKFHQGQVWHSSHGKIKGGLAAGQANSTTKP